MKGQLILREARRNEVPAIVRMLADDALGRSREDTGEPQEVYYQAFDEVAGDRNNRLLIAERDGEIVGTLQLTIIPGLSRRAAKRAQIEAVRVTGARRGEGIGEEMLRAAIEMSRACGCRLVQLTTDKQRTDARRLYERLGFVASHEGMKLALD